MAQNEHEDDLLRPRQGRLDESADLANLRRLLNAPRGQSVYLPSFRSQSRQGRPFREIEHRFPTAYRTDATKGAIVSTFHFQQTFLSRRPLPSVPRSVLTGKRAAIWPTRGQAKLVKSAVASARYHRDQRVWTLLSGHRFLKTAIGQALCSPIARAASTLRRTKATRMGIRKRAIWFAHYVTRTGPLADRADELVSDKAGPIIESTIGISADELSWSWTGIDAAEPRVDGRIQERLIVELPHWLPPEEMRSILQRFGAELTAKGLPWVGAVHRPDLHGDSRNFHLHIIIGTRPVIGWEMRAADNDPTVLRRTPIFAQKKDRATQGEKWIASLRKTYADIVNETALDWANREKALVPRIFHAGSNAELGIESIPSEHRGPRRSAIDRRIIVRGGEPRRIPAHEFPDDRHLAHILRGFDADRVAFLALCERIERLIIDTEATDLIRNSRASLLTAADTAAATIELCEEKIEAVLAEFQLDRDDESQIVDNDRVLSNRLREFVDAVRAAVAQSHEIEKELISLLARNAAPPLIPQAHGSGIAKPQLIAIVPAEAEASIDHQAGNSIPPISSVEITSHEPEPSLDDHREPVRSALLSRAIGAIRYDQPQSLINAFDALRRILEHDRNALEAIKATGVLDGTTPTQHREAKDAHFGVFKKHLAADESLRRCERLVALVCNGRSNDLPPKHAGQQNEMHLSDPVTAENVLASFEESGRHISALVGAFDLWQEIERRLKDVPYIDERLREPKNLVPWKIDEVDPIWAIAEIQRQLSRCRWIPRHRGQRITKKTLHDLEISLGDELEARIRYSRTAGWTIDFPNLGGQPATNRQRLWRELISKLFEISSLSIGIDETTRTLKRYGFTEIEADENGVIEIRRHDGLLRVARDGRFAHVYGKNVELHAVCDALSRMRSSRTSFFNIQKILEAKTEPPMARDTNALNLAIDLNKIADGIRYTREIEPIDRQYVRLTDTPLFEHQAALNEFHPELKTLPLARRVTATEETMQQAQLEITKSVAAPREDHATANRQSATPYGSYPDWQSRRDISSSWTRPQTMSAASAPNEKPTQPSTLHTPLKPAAVAPAPAQKPSAGDPTAPTGISARDAIRGIQARGRDRDRGR